MGTRRGLYRPNVASIIDQLTFDISSAFVVIEREHHAVHSGVSYWLADATTLGNGETLDLLIKTGAADCHLEPILVTSAEATITIYEDTTVSADGTAQAVINRNRTSENTSGAAIYVTPTVTGTGTQLAKTIVGVGRQVGGAARGAYELVLKPSSNYLLRTVNDAVGDNIISYQIDFYEAD